MKLVCSQTELSTALGLACRAVAARPTHPVLANVLLTADQATNQLSLTGFDMSLGIQSTIQATIEESGAITLPARLFEDIVCKLPHDCPVTLSAEQEEVEITSLSGSYQMKGIIADDFPNLPLEQSTRIFESITLNPIALLQGLKSTVFASSNDESKQLLTGVHLHLDEEGLECAATDGHRLAVINLPQPNDGGSPLDVTVPARSLRELERLLANHSEPITLSFDKGQLIVICDNQLMTTRTLDGVFPSYSKLIPATFTTEVTLNRKAFIASLERIGVLAEQHNNVAKISFSDENALITVEAQDVGSGSETVAATILGENLDVAFNVRYLVEGLKSIKSEQITIKANQPTTPAIVIPSDDVDYTYLVMPVQIRS